MKKNCSTENYKQQSVIPVGFEERKGWRMSGVMVRWEDVVMAKIYLIVSTWHEEPWKTTITIIKALILGIEPRIFNNKHRFYYKIPWQVLGLIRVGQIKNHTVKTHIQLFIPCPAVLASRLTHISYSLENYFYSEIPENL